MRNERLLTAISYASVATIAVGLAFLVSLRFVARSHSQAAAETAATTVGEKQRRNRRQGLPPKDRQSESAKAVLDEVNGFLEPFIYDSKNRRDPFQPFVEVRTRIRNAEFC